MLGLFQSDCLVSRNKRIQTIHYGVALNQFQNEQPQVFENSMILYIGTIIRKKGVFELPEILKRVTSQHPEAQLVLIGGDSPDILTGSPSSWQLLQQEFNAADIEKSNLFGKNTLPRGSKVHETSTSLCLSQLCRDFRNGYYRIDGPTKTSGKHRYWLGPRINY